MAPVALVGFDCIPVWECPSPEVANIFLVLFSLFAGCAPFAPRFCEDKPVMFVLLLLKDTPLNWSPRLYTEATPTLAIDPDELEVPRVLLPGRTKLYPLEFEVVCGCVWNYSPCEAPLWIITLLVVLLIIITLYFKCVVVNNFYLL